MARIPPHHYATTHLLPGTQTRTQTNSASPFPRCLLRSKLSLHPFVAGRGPTRIEMRMQHSTVQKDTKKREREEEGREEKSRQRIVVKREASQAGETRSASSREGIEPESRKGRRLMLRMSGEEETRSASMEKKRKKKAKRRRGQIKDRVVRRMCVLTRCGRS